MSFKNNRGFEKLNEIFAENSKWANLSISIKEIAEDNKSLVKDISKYDPKFAIPLLSGLLTVPKLQSNSIRIEVLVVLATCYCEGSKKANVSQVVDWFNQIGKSKCVLGEDPAEDIFVSLVLGENGDYRLLEGTWESAGFYTQRVLEVIKTMPDHGHYGGIKESFNALLKLSDLVCERSNLERYQLGSDKIHTSLTAGMIPGGRNLTSRVTFSKNELEKYDIRLDDLAPFVLQSKMYKQLRSQVIGNSHLESRPLMEDEDNITVILPSTLSVALRNFVIEEVLSGGLGNPFDQALANNYSKTFGKIPLLGGSIKAPIRWKEFDKFRLSYFYYQIDKGYYISFHFYLPSIQIHSEGGMNEFYQDDGKLTKELQNSIDEVVTYFEDIEDFKEGIIVFVGCGWGKGHATQPIELDHTDWRLENISSADLYRISWHHDLSPSYFWRIQDGLETVRKAGVNIFNVNGIMNLIGWVQYNDGHLIPHSKLPEKRISVEHPLMLNPPLNMLREVRAEADQGYDRHSAEDNIGQWHIVQRNSAKPLFSNESSRRIYSSLDAVDSGKLTSVYEGQFKLWISINVPNISDKEVEYQLWKMAVEWLHRIGADLDERFETSPKQKDPVKVIIEFQDSGPFEEIDEKPDPKELSSLCLIESCNEQNACKIIFKDGFIDGFRIAENVAERYVVRTLIQAFLNLLDIEYGEHEIETIEDQVVPNDDARSFHLFHAHNFIAYVKDFLPDNLLFINPIDHAAAKIGLAFRVLDNSGKEKITGRKECKNFLNKIVDSLIDEIIETLSEFDRISVLKRLVANNELAYYNEDHWKRTSAAVLGLHSDKPDAENCYVEQLSKFAGAAISSRVLIEMALCECPKEGGKVISDLELSKLLARVSLVVQYGGVSDAIYYNVLSPKLTISSLGDILFDDKFGRAIVRPMLTRVMGDQFVASAPNQKKNYEEPEIVLEIKDKISDEFWEIWKKEMGFTLDEARNIIDTLENLGIEDNTAILSLKQSEFIELVSSNIVSQSSAKKFLKQFSLSRRPKWNKPPKGFTLKDIYPWRFGRRLSFVTRPILRLDMSDDPMLMIAPGALKKGFLYVFDGAYRGKLDQKFFRSNEMKNSWLAKVKEGHTFNDQTADELSKAGWQVRKNIGLPEILNRKTQRNYGDVDVLAWDPKRKDILVIECKDLSLARNYSEIAALLSDYQGDISNGKPDKLRKHLDRVELLEKNCEKLERFTGVDKPQIKSCLICDGVVPMQYSKIDALSDTLVGDISDVLRI